MGLQGDTNTVERVTALHSGRTYCTLLENRIWMIHYKCLSDKKRITFLKWSNTMVDKKTENKWYPFFKSVNHVLRLELMDDLLHKKVKRMSHTVRKCLFSTESTSKQKSDFHKENMKKTHCYIYTCEYHDRHCKSSHWRTN